MIAGTIQNYKLGARLYTLWMTEIKLPKVYALKCSTSFKFFQKSVPTIQGSDRKGFVTNHSDCPNVHGTTKSPFSIYQFSEDHVGNGLQ